jgi:ABC-type lipoprotein export system ATPase subunit
LDQPGPRCAIGLFGPAGSGKTVLLDALRSGALRTPQDRRVICAALDAARLSAARLSRTRRRSCCQGAGPADRRAA